jgi:hypothetical protein
MDALAQTAITSPELSLSLRNFQEIRELIGKPPAVKPRRREQLGDQPLGYTGARSVTISAGAAPAVARARWKNARAALVSRFTAK